MKIQLIDSTLYHSGSLSIGAWYVKNGMESHGHHVDVHPKPADGYDCELIAAHHVTDYKDIVNMPKRSPVRVIGGHALYSNHKPLVPFTDYLCFGEWDTGFKDFEELQKSQHVNQRDFKTQTPLLTLRPYLNHAATKSAAWYIEIARGCPFSCHYCELGHSLPYRPYSVEQIKQAIDLCDFSKTRKVNFFAPDEASHPGYDELLEYIIELGGFPAGFSSMRVERAQKLHSIRNNMLIRVGIDGLTEKRRFDVNKRISNRDIIAYFRAMLSHGHSNFKIFMIFGYEGENVADFVEFERVMAGVFSLPLKKNVSLRIKWTPFIPQPNTPLAETHSQYDIKMVKKIQGWHQLHRRSSKTPGWFVESDGIMSKRSHKEQCILMTASEDYFL